MDQVEYGDMVRALAKKGYRIIETMTPNQAALMHMVMGICGEAGELLDAVKKHIIYNKELDMKNVIEELGDIEFYMEGMRQVINTTRENTLEANMMKLKVRYDGFKYTDQRAQERADKK